MFWFICSVALLDGVVNTVIVELGEVQLAKYLSEKTFTGQPSFQNGTYYICMDYRFNFKFRILQMLETISCFFSHVWFFKIIVEYGSSGLKKFIKCIW